MYCAVRMNLKTINSKMCFKKNVAKEHLQYAFKKPIRYCLYTGIILELLGTSSMLFASGFTQNVASGTVVVREMVSNPANPFEPFTKSGPGDFVANSSTYSGNTTVAAGRFFAMGTHGDGTSGQTTTIESGATLVGPGPIHTSVVQNADSIVSPSAGGVNFSPSHNIPSIQVGTTMNVTGNYTSAGQTWLYFSPPVGESRVGDKIVITGAFDASSGTLYITPAPGHYPSLGTATYTAITWTVGSATPETWGYDSSNGTTTALPSNIVITTAAAGPNYLELNVTARQTATGLAFTFAGVDKNLSSGATVGLSTLTSVTGTINAASGTVIAPASGGTVDAPVTTAIATEFSISSNSGSASTATVAPTENSKTQLAGKVVGDTQAVLAVSGTDAATAASRVVEVSGDASTFQGTYSASNAKLVINTTTPGSVSVGSGGIIAGSGTVNKITANGGTLSSGNSIGTLTINDGLIATDTHVKVEIDAATNSLYAITGNTSLTNVTADVVMDADTYTVGTHTYDFLTTTDSLTGNINTLTWVDHSGLVYDIGLNTSSSPKKISLIATVTGANIVIGSNQASVTDYASGAYTSRKKRRIITATSETATSLIGNYDYITLINGTISNASDQTLSVPINIVGSSSISTSSGTTTLGTANTLAGASTTTLNITGSGTTAITAANPNFLGTVAVGSGAKLSLGTSLPFDPSVGITLTSGTLQLPTGMTLSYPVSSTGTSAINTTGTTTLDSALSNTSGTTLKLTGGTTTINRTNSGLSGTLNVEGSTLYLGSSAVLGSGTLALTSSAILNNSSSGLTNPINATSSTINLDAGKNLGSGALSLTSSTLNFSSGGSGTTTLTNSGITITGASTLYNNVGSVYLGSGALIGAGTLNFTSGHASYTTYITGNNSGFTGPVNISSKVNIGNGWSLGTGALTPQSGANITLGNTTLSNPIAMTAAAATFTVNPGASAILSNNFSGTNTMSVNSSTTGSGYGSLTLSGGGSDATPISATNINLSMNGSSNAAVTAGANTVLSGHGTVGPVTLGNGAIFQPGDSTSNSMTVSNISVTPGTTPRLYVRITDTGLLNQVYVTNAGVSYEVDLTNLTVCILANPGNFLSGATTNYSFLIPTGVTIKNSGGTNYLLDALYDDQGGNVSYKVGFTSSGQLALQSITADGAGSFSFANSGVGSSHATIQSTISELTTVRFTNDTTITPASLSLAAPAANTPVNLSNSTFTNNIVGTTINADLTVTGSSTISTSAGATTYIQNAVSSASGTTLTIAGQGETTLAANNSTLRGAIAINQATVNVTQNLGTGATSLTSGATLKVNNGGILNNSVSAAENTSIVLTPSTGNTVTVNGALSGAGNVYIEAPAGGGAAGGKALFTAANPSLSGLVQVNSTTAEVADGASLGTGELNLAGTSPNITMGNVTLPNAISATVASSFTADANKTAILSGAITGNNALTFNGAGTKKLTANSPLYEGTMQVDAGKLVHNGNISNANVIVGASGTLSGVGYMKDLELRGTLKPGNSIGTIYVTGNYTAADQALYIVEIDPTGRSDRTIVTGNATLNGTHIIKPILSAGTYPKGVIDFNILQAGGTLTVDQIQIKYVRQAAPANLTFTAGVLALTSSTGSEPVGKTLVLRYENTGDEFTIAAPGQDTNVATDVNIDAHTPTTITIASTDIVSSDSGLRDATVAPVAPQTELTSIVFQSNSSEITSAATADAFRFKGFSSGTTPSVSGKKNTMEALLTALSKNGPVSYERNETRLWVTPFVNRSRTNRTSSDLGNQGWSGGSLIGLEQRDKKNIWSAGLLTGLMGSRSHVLGAPDTFSKTNGFLIGAFNTYKYTKKWGHELLISRTNTFIDSQRYGLDSTDKTTPFYAISNYKSTTDVGNAQLNYLFNIIKKKITCRLNTGITYIDSQTGKITERNASTNGLSTDASKNSSTELYSGIGLRRIWNIDKTTIRTTFVYEYGYQLTSTGSATKTTTQSVAPTTFTTPPGPRQNKHYLQLNSSYLDRNTGLKFILSYSGALYKNVRNHTGMAKVEYRF